MRRLAVGSWQLVAGTANFWWVRCVQRVQELWLRLGQTPYLTHRPLSTYNALWEKLTLVHCLYHFCAQQLHTRFDTFIPPLCQSLSTSSTGLTITTTNINK